MATTTATPVTRAAPLDQRWQRRIAGDRDGRHHALGLTVLLVCSAVLYLWQANVSGWSNEYYAAAARAGATSWKAFFFGSLDAGNAITVDKPPLGVWPMALSVRLFGPTPFSVLLPQALEGVAAVAVIVSLVQRATRSSRLGLLAGAVFAVTPVSVLVFRYDNPDALLVLLLVAAAAATLRGLDSERAGAWMALTGALVGLGFLTKMGEALMIVPALTATYLLYARCTWSRRLLHLLGAGATLVLSAGWWVTVVTLWPTGSRPWIGGSTTNSVMELAFGYNGVGRISGSDAAASTGGTWQLSRAGSVFGLPSATAALWLMPAALILTVAALQVTRGDRTYRRQRAALVLWLVWAVTMLTVFAVMTGIFHSYYTIMLAPATAILAVVAGAIVVEHRALTSARRALVLAAVATAALAFVLLTLTPGWLPGLRWVVGLTLLGLAVALHRVRSTPYFASWTLTAAVLLGLVAPIAVSLATVAAPHSGSSPVVGPGPGAAPADGIARSRVVADMPFLDAPVGGDVGGQTASPDVAALLRNGASGFRWVAASGGARIASAYELASGAPVIAIGGYKGTDPTPTLPAFEQLVGVGEVHYFFPGWTTGSAESQIENWVATHFEQLTIDNLAVYDLTAPL